MNRSCLRAAWYMLERCGRLLGHDGAGAQVFVLDGQVWLSANGEARLIGDYFVHMSLVRKGIRKLVRA